MILLNLFFFLRGTRVLLSLLKLVLLLSKLFSLVPHVVLGFLFVLSLVFDLVQQFVDENFSALSESDLDLVVRHVLGSKLVDRELVDVVESPLVAESGSEALELKHRGIRVHETIVVVDVHVVDL